ncbi:uncharacterized protein LOC131851297 [Achroia grisella]|uniref:uncharacterized protein LOC131851297 n=1 Tax=Achroia grisella TaxID=688607 RepID=UPI0027D2ECC8|nr:uncharacterized protein LOC131851297 [Achroia grisella]
MDTEWTNSLVIKLMEEYRKKPELWDNTHKGYRTFTAKYEAWSDLANTFNCDIPDLRKKLNSIFASHRREKSKDSKESNKLEDMNDETSNDNDHEIDDIHEEITIKEEPVIQAYKPKTYKYSNSNSMSRSTKVLKRRPVREVPNTSNRMDSKILETLRLIKKTGLSRKKDECDSFGEYIADSLRKHDDRTQSMIKQAINNILFEQEMKKFSTNQYEVVITGIDENPLILGDTDDNDK